MISLRDAKPASGRNFGNRVGESGAREGMNDKLIGQEVKQLQERVAPGGGFAMQRGGDFRPDATAWAVIALRAWGDSSGLVEAAQQRLAAAQGQDGRLCMAPEHPESYWPTSLAVLAWHEAPAYKEARERAVAFLSVASGILWDKMPEHVVGHDPTLKGWSWRSDTVPWSEPTALTLMALEAAGLGEHPRVEEARRLLLDRQLPGGGWNYGNTTVFGQVLNPMPESTGMVLNALSGKISREVIHKSIAYLKRRLAALKTPWSLGWALLGLAAWGVRPESTWSQIQTCLARQERFQGYGTSSLALLLVATKATGGLLSIFPPGIPSGHV